MKRGDCVLASVSSGIVHPDAARAPSEPAAVEARDTGRGGFCRVKRLAYSLTPEQPISIGGTRAKVPVIGGPN